MPQRFRASRKLELCHPEYNPATEPNEAEKVEEVRGVKEKPLPHVRLFKMSDHQREPWAGRSFSIRVMKFSSDVCPFFNRNHTWQQFHTFRNGVLDILSPYGTVGPSGKMPILDACEESQDARRAGHPKPDFFVVDDDMYGLSVRVEARWTMAKPILLEELAMFLKQSKEWCVYLALIKGGLFVFHDRILFEGDFFTGCSCVDDIYHRCAQATDAVNKQTGN